MAYIMLHSAFKMSKKFSVVECWEATVMNVKEVMYSGVSATSMNMIEQNKFKVGWRHNHQDNME